MQFLIDTIAQVQWQQVVMWIIGGILIFLAIKKGMEPALLLPMGFGAILVNIRILRSSGREESFSPCSR